MIIKTGEMFMLMSFLYQSLLSFAKSCMEIIIYYGNYSVGNLRCRIGRLQIMTNENDKW